MASPASRLDQAVPQEQLPAAASSVPASGPSAGAASAPPLEESLERARRDWCSNWQERRSHQRYPLGNPFSCELQLDSGHFPPMPVQLVDISLGGACLLISSLVELRRGEMGELRRHHPGDPLHRRRLWVCWQEVRDWITAVGVAFDPPLEQLPLRSEPAEA